MNFRLILVLTGCIAVANVLAASQEKPDTPIKPQDFAYAVPLQFDGSDALYRATLPLSVYQNTVRSDLGDLRVFNAQGEVVPYIIQQMARSTIDKAERHTLVYFPLQGAVNADLDQLSIRIKRNASGTLIDMGGTANQSPTSKISGYLLDTSAIKQSVQALVLDWGTNNENFVGTLNIESSDDLKHWRTILQDAPLASLQYDGHRLLQNRVEFSAIHSKYLRLSWPQEQSSMKVRDISAELSPVSVETPLSWLSTKGTPISDKAGEYLFDIDAHLPVQRVRIELPQKNTLVQATLFTRTRVDDLWRPVSNPVLYKLLHSGQEFRNPDIPVASNHRFWLLRVDQKSGGLGKGTPELQVGWQAHQLQFVTRGSRPFQLAYGNKEIKPAVFRLRSFMPPSEKDKPALIIKTAKTGAQVELGGGALLNPSTPEPPWRKWILWAALGLSVMMLGWMAFRLVKQIESTE